jgi:hypothetical protein
MHRRQVLALGAALGLSGLAGCLGGGAGADPTGTEGTDAEPSTSALPEDGLPDPDRTTSYAEPAGTVRDYSFEISGREGSGEEGATVSAEAGTVTVAGTIVGNNGCYTARLDAVEVTDDRLTVAVASEEDAPTNGGCSAALVYLDYRARVEMAGRLPIAVTVEHDGEHVTTAHEYGTTARDLDEAESNSHDMNI